MLPLWSVQKSGLRAAPLVAQARQDLARLQNSPTICNSSNLAPNLCYAKIDKQLCCDTSLAHFCSFQKDNILFFLTCQSSYCPIHLACKSKYFFSRENSGCLVSFSLRLAFAVMPGQTASQSMPMAGSFHIRPPSSSG